MSDTIEETLPAHAPLGPSSAEGWSTCADYVNANRGLPDRTTEPAAEGTAAHAVSDLCLMLGLDADDFLGMPTRIKEHLFAWEEDDAMLLQGGIDRLRAAAGFARFYGEQRVDISTWTLPGQFGTLDRAYVIQIDGEWWVVIEDLKWGRGIAVSPVANKQLMLYALGFWWAVARHQLPKGVRPRFRLIVDQPRHAGGGGIWNTTLDELLTFGEWIKERAALTAAPVAPRTASLKGCIWCRRRRAPSGCDTYDEYMIALLGLDWSDIDLGILMDTELDLPRALTADRRSYLLLHKDSIRRWLDQLEEEAVLDGLAGADTGLVKVVAGNKAADKWRDKGVDAAPVVAAHLGDFGFNKRLKSPKQVVSAAEEDEAALAAIAGFIEPGGRKPTLVPLDDARPPLLTGKAFDDLDGNQ